jgi:transposase
MIDAVIERCAGIDVGKKFILVCALCGPSHEAPRVEVRTYGTTTHALQTLERWLFGLGCLHVVMESTGDYWKPIFNILEERMTVVLANPAHIKNIPGCKTARGWRICYATVWCETALFPLDQSVY